MPAIAEDFSYASARDGLDEYWTLVPRAKRATHLPALQEVYVVLEAMFGFFVAGLDRAEQDRAKTQDVRKVMSAYLDRMRAE